MRLRLLIYILSMGVLGNAQPDIMEIGVLRNVDVTYLNLTCREGQIKVYGDTLHLLTLSKEDQVRVKKSGDGVNLKAQDQDLGNFQEVRFIQEDEEGETYIYVSSPKKRYRIFPGDVFISTEPERLKIINHLDLEDYIAGVVETEVGYHRTKEYYKVQAILARTYALGHLDKRADEGFMLTDLVLDQAYHGKSRKNPEIYEAVRETRGIVAVDDSLDLITAAYSSNSGGQTARPQDVWRNPVSYLKSVIDTFSIGQQNYDWTKRISKSQWLNYLEKNYSYPVDSAEARIRVLNYRQPFREAFLVHPRYGIPLRDVRRDFRLKSTFFSVFDDGDHVLLKGRGFGHGVGLSQEGAIRMAEAGYSYQQILHFYFTGIHLIHMRDLTFYKEGFD